MKYKITFLYSGYVVGIWYNDCDDKQSAIESAKLVQVNNYDTVIAEKIL